MHRVDATNHYNNTFTDGNAQTGIAPTTLAADWHNSVQEELANVVEFTGDTLDRSDNTQLLTNLIPHVGGMTALRAIAPVSGYRVYLKYHTTAGDGGHGVFRGVTGAAAATYTHDGGVYIVPSGGDGSAAWVRDISAPINVRWFGAQGDGSTNDTAAIQAAVDYAQGKALYAPAGRYKFGSAVTTSYHVNIRGDGNGCGPGAAAISNSGVTQFLVAGNFYAFVITTTYSCIFEDIQFNVPVANRPQTSGGAISITGTGTATFSNGKIVNCGFTNICTPIYWLAPSQNEIQGCYFDTWTTAAVYMLTRSGYEAGGGHIHANFFFGNTTAPVTQGPAIYTENGYIHIHDNLFVGATRAIYGNITNFPAGGIRISNNWIEEQYTAGIDLQTYDDNDSTMIQIHDNEFSNITNTAITSHIVIREDTTNPDWISNVTLHDNVYRSQLDAGKKYIWIQAAKYLKIHNEQINDLGSNNPTGIQITGATINTGLIDPKHVFDCQITGTTAPYSFHSSAKTTLRDLAGIAFASLPSNCADGSIVYCTDGTIASPVAGGGTGCIAKRLNGAWVGN